MARGTSSSPGSTEPAAAVVAIDGPSGSGKSTVARRVAQRLGFRYLDTGAMYRAVTWRALDAGVDLTDAAALARLAEGACLEPGTNPRRPLTVIDGTDVTTPIRSREVTAAVSAVSAVPGVRAALVRRQRELMAGGGIVVEGRDIGTTVAPGAPVKIFLTASSEARAARRHRQVDDTAVGEHDTRADIERRDQHDSTRAASPLAQAPDAVVIDSTDRTIDQVVGEVLAVASRRGLAARARASQAGEAAQAPAVGACGDVANGDGGPSPRGRERAGGGGRGRYRAGAGGRHAGTEAAVVTTEKVGDPMDLVAPVSPRRRRPLPDVSLNPRFYRAMTSVVRHGICRMLDVRVRHSDRVPVTGAVLVAGNHRSFLDGPLVATFVPRPASFLVKSELFRPPLVHPLSWLGQIPVDRGRPDRHALRRALGVLTDGGVLGMFPEGTRGAGLVGSVQHGIAYLALRNPGVPIVPVACIGTDRAMPMGSRRLRRGTRVDIVFGEPFTVTAPANPRARSAVAAAAEEIRVALARHVAQAEAEVEHVTEQGAQRRTVAR